MSYAQGVNWVNRTPDPITATNNPAGRDSSSAMAYDSDRGRVVLFGGGGASADTWEWDGTNWLNRTPTVITSANNPPARYFSAMVYDSDRKRCVLFGGYGPDGQRRRDTWEWDGNGWTQKTPSPLTGENNPPISSGMSMVYDDARERVVMFGNSNVDFSNMTWEWDGITWVNRTPAIITARNNPSRRVFTAMAYDEARQRTVLFGGLVFGPDGAYSNETWEWDGGTWVYRTPAVVTATNNPSACGRQSMDYDALRRRVVLFGGVDSDSHALNQTWEWVVLIGPI